MLNIFSILLLFSSFLPFSFKPKQNKYRPCTMSAIYLTTGAEAHDLEHPWGGCHITMTGFHSSHNDEIFLQKVPQILQKNSLILKEWRPRKIKVEKWGKYWAVIIHSKTLNKLTQEFDKHGFKKIKGPLYTKADFHMILDHLQTREAAEDYAKTLKDKTWFITIVRKDPSSKHFNWLKYYPLYTQMGAKKEAFSLKKSIFDSISL